MENGVLVSFNSNVKVTTFLKKGCNTNPTKVGEVKIEGDNFSKNFLFLWLKS